MWFHELGERYPSVSQVAMRLVLWRLRGKQPPVRVDWPETLLDMKARFINGLLLGAVVCFLLVPVVYWPGRRGKKSVFEAWGQPEWMGTFFLTVWVGTAVVMMMRTKARVYHADPKRTDPVVWY